VCQLDDYSGRQQNIMNTQKFYDSYWNSGSHVCEEWDEKQFRRILGPLIGGEKVLDYGCGLGFAYQKRLVGAVRNYIGADIASVALENAKSKNLEATRIAPESGRLELPDNTFDGAVCVEVFEHLFDPLASAREIFRVLKPGGVFVATVPNFGYHAWRFLALLRAQVPSEPENKKLNRYNGVHIRYFSKLMFKRLLYDAGFVDVKIGSFDESSVWDVFLAAGHFGAISQFARDKFPSPLRMSFLQDVWPNVFAIRLRAAVRKP
jgi:SAM-dependent methyltransferase